MRALYTTKRRESAFLPFIQNMGIIILYLQQEMEISHVDKSEINEYDRV
jgi:hypothetical protein